MEFEILKNLRDNIGKVMIGNERTVKLILTALLARGHVLLEDVPGTGKTVLAKSLAKSVDAQFGRVQFTPDLLPSDVTGLNYFDAKEGEFKFREGPVFCNILLADEINRATPKTQSSLLECMAEHQVTVDGVTRKLAEPFFVIATQNPLETLGTFPLPEAQMDRFLMRISMEDMTQGQELAMVERFLLEEPLEELGKLCGGEELLALQEQCRQVYIHRDLLKYDRGGSWNKDPWEGHMWGQSKRDDCICPRCAGICYDRGKRVHRSGGYKKRGCAGACSSSQPVSLF